MTVMHGLMKMSEVRVVRALVSLGVCRDRQFIDARSHGEREKVRYKKRVT